jgi:hypothetical protein
VGAVHKVDPEKVCTYRAGCVLLVVTLDAIVGVPHTLVKLVVSGGKYVTVVVGAVPYVMPEVAVPPDKLLALLSYQVVVMFKTLDTTLACTCT